MKFGLISANLMGGVEPQAAAAVAQAAEATGFHSIWAIEHVVVPKSYSSTYPYDEGGRLFRGASQLDHADPLIWLAFAAAATSQIRLATGILILPQRNPLVLAKEISSLDRLSGGRFDFGIGVGWLREEFEALGVPFERRGARTDEYVAALRTLWTETEAEFHGEFVDFEPVYSQPKPVQQPLPIVVGGHTNRAARRAGELGDVFFPAERPPEVLDDLFTKAKQHAETAGRDPAELQLWTSGPADGDLLARFEDIGVSQVMLTARPADRIADTYGEFIASHS